MKLNTLFENFSSQLHKQHNDSSDEDSDIASRQTLKNANLVLTYPQAIKKMDSIFDEYSFAPVHDYGIMITQTDDYPVMKKVYKLTSRTMSLYITLIGNLNDKPDNLSTTFIFQTTTLSTNEYSLFNYIKRALKNESKGFMFNEPATNSNVITVANFLNDFMKHGEDDFWSVS